MTQQQLYKLMLERGQEPQWTGKLSDCLYPDWEGGLEKGTHDFDKDGFCKVCGMTIEQASNGNIKNELISEYSI